ncbi:hypothetical protein BOTBODRAFT_59582 [Botryobasidium botryosum FD-172 SS1]|uniref:Barwin domain-containing protein n=1 Tax=Botryobasidium botryosum (strain FD-172 SS1) TaxID=930990 RepID=A0A067M8W8_BOTB1|nr:hypothetical protein BOTBODRAFT_59582 [Botryobasidium botryosum FD-172 SS1]
MHFSTLLLTAFAATAAYACTSCPHPGTFSGNIAGYPSATENYCGVTLTSSQVGASISNSFLDPPDESPCGEAITVTLTSDGKTTQAIVVNFGNSLSVGDVNLTTNGLAALAPDSDPNHGTGPGSWTFN